MAHGSNLLFDHVFFAGQPPHEFRNGAAEGQVPEEGGNCRRSGTSLQSEPKSEGEEVWRDEGDVKANATYDARSNRDDSMILSIVADARKHQSVFRPTVNITKDLLQTALIISQADRKFVLARTRCAWVWVWVLSVCTRCTRPVC